MPRRARVVAIDYPHHITQRGNFQQKIFGGDKDRERYLSWIQEYSNRYKLSILSYCLMPNHVHFLVIPRKENSLARTFNIAHMCYSQYLNKKMQRNGHLWQGRFFSCVLDEPHLIMAARYIERNPVRAKLVSKPWQWQWSSAQAHTNRGKSSIHLENLFNFIDTEPHEWKEYIDIKEDREIISDIKKHTFAGRPLGGESFMEMLEKKLDRRFPVLTKGRPRKSDAK